MWDELRKEFIGMDVEGTGCVSAEQFRTVLTELCVHLSDFEQDLLAKKFMVDDSRFVQFVVSAPFHLPPASWAAECRAASAPSAGKRRDAL